MDRPEFYEIDKSKIHLYDKLQLYVKSENKFILYKSAGQSISNRNIDTVVLYINSEDKINFLNNLHRKFNNNLRSYIQHFETEKIKKELYDIMDDALEIHSHENIMGLKQTVDIFVEELSANIEYIEALINFSNKDYSTTIHSINCMAFMLEFCYKSGINLAKTGELALGAMLHDIGKIYIPDEILKKRTVLSESEFAVMRTHVKEGYEVLEKLNINRLVKQCCHEHHERLDGSGYPAGIRKISPEGQLMGIIDCYEALVSHSRVYKRGLTPLEASEIIKSDVQKGKWNKTMFEMFIRTRLRKE
ncbi:MAG: HD domain-containing protein [Spirochaetes bacterium]|nr:HD domain-containing protein [Spirochaetota bacterium]